MKNIYAYSAHCFILFFLFFNFTAFAQPSNDDCDGALPIPNVVDWCSDIEEYFNVGATPSGFGAPSCFNNVNNDVWFSFTAVATDVVIVVNGNSGNAAGGTLNQPEVTLYTGSCSGTINEQDCESATGSNNIVELYKGGMVIGQTYYIRIQGANNSNNTGTFQLCVDNFNPPVFPGSDCVTSSILCDKTAFVIPQVTGSGNDNNEAGNTSCLGGTNSESNSTWFTWVAGNNGTLTFSLEPLNASDDLDFVLFILPDGIQNCGNKQEIRCMASGAFNFPSPCMGPTGLAEGSGDVTEPPGCSNPSQDNFLKPLDMVEGTAYSLMINNFSGTGNGFSIEFGGDGEFDGPEADFSAQPFTTCYGEPITFNDASNFPGGVLNSWVWSFGVGANPANAAGPGPHQVTWDSPGIKSVSLLVGTEDGCQLTTVGAVTVDPCCDGVNAISADANLTELLCPSIPNGAIDLMPISNVPVSEYAWNTGATTEDINNLGLGSYMVTITNEATCENTFSYDIGAPQGISIAPQITMPRCMNGMDGEIVLNVTGGVSPYQFNWGNGFTPDNSLLNIGVGIYDVTILDANNCQENLTLDVRELELVLDTNIPTVTPPSCFESSDGSVVFNIANGTPPFLFDYNDGNGFVTTNVFNGLNAGTFNVTFQDASGCIGDTLVNVTPPSIVELTESAVNASCFGVEDGIAEVSVTGGVGNYTFLWDDPAEQTDSIAIGLAPGTYNVTVADGNGCSKTTSISLTQPNELFLTIQGVEDVLCFGDSTGTVAVFGGGGNPSYEYSLDEINFQTDSIFNDVKAGTFPVFVRDEMGCVASTLATIAEPAQLVVDAGRDTTVELGYPVRVSALPFPLFRPVAFSWFPDNSLNCNDCSVIEGIFPNTTTLSVMITDSTGCVAVDSVVVNVVKNRPIYIPNAFSPNADGVNDYFTAYGGPGALQIRTIRVFNRWGALVFEKENISLNEESIGWDGTFKGEILSPDVYVYYIEVDFIDEVNVSYEGGITIIK